jgi:hypothetical protein
MTRTNLLRLGGGTVTNRWLFALLTLSLAAGVAGCSEDAGSATSADEIKSQPRRDVVSRMALPLLEVSGLAARDGRFVAVGDRSSDIISFGLDPAGEAVDVVVHRTGVATGKSGSQWEAIALDGAGNAAVLSETGELFVFAKDLEGPSATVKIDYQSVNALIDGHVEQNSLGEGLVLLEGGHILVAIEKSPSVLVEMGPAGSAPAGYAPGREVHGRFAPGATTFVALAAWQVKDNGSTPDLSDLTVGPTGALFALTQQGRAFVRLEATLRPDEKSAHVKEVFPIDKQLTFAEGLVFRGLSPVVGRDRDHDAKNVYVLSPIP